MPFDNKKKDVCCNPGQDQVENNSFFCDFKGGAYTISEIIWRATYTVPITDQI